MVVPVDIAAALPMLIRDAQQQCAPMDDEALMASLTAVVAAIGMGLPQSEKREWMTVAAVECCQFPARLCQEALRDATTACDSLRQVLKHVRTYCEDYPQRMRARLDRLETLLAIARGDGLA
jgi:dissimilatory sulfite reductase (desulfoviridin) alpha/beta subunit